MSEPVSNQAGNVSSRSGGAVLVLSLVLAMLSQWLDPVINRDGMYYVDVARSVAAHGAAAAAAYDWPFLPLLLGKIAALLSLDALLVAKTYAVICGALLPVLLFGLLRQYDRSHPLLAALVALGLPFVAGYMDYITRDIGAWVAMLAVLHLSLSWRERGGVVRLCALLLCAVLAFLLRTEMALLLVLLLYLPLERRRRQHGRWLARSRMGNVTLLLVAAAVVLPAAWMALERVDVYREAIARSPHMHTFPEFVGRLTAQVNPFLADDMALVMAAGLVALVLGELAGLTGLYLLPLLLGLRAGSVRVVVNRDGGVSLLLAAAFLMVVLVFVFVMQFVVGRYLVPTALMLAPLVYLGLVHWQGRPRRWPLTAFLVVALLAALQGYLSSDRHKHYIIDAGDWVSAHHSELAPLHYDDARVAFYAGDRYDPRIYKPLVAAPDEAVKTLVLSFSDPQQLASLRDDVDGIAAGFPRLLHRVENDRGRGVVILGR